MSVRFIALLVLGTLIAGSVAAATRQVPPAPWDLDSIYPTEAAWREERERIEAGLARVALLEREPIRTSAALAQLLAAVSDVRGRAGKMAKVGLLQYEADTSSEGARRRSDEGRALELRVERAAGFVEPLIRNLGRNVVEEWMRQDPALARHRRRIARTFALTPFAPQQGREEIGTMLTILASNASDLYNEATRTDLAWPSIDGSARLDFAEYLRLRRSPDAARRHAAVSRFLSHLGGYEELFAKILRQRIEGDRLIAGQRNLRDPIDLLHVVNDGLEPQSHRAMFTAAREAHDEVGAAAAVLARLHGTERLRYADLSAPLRPPEALYPLDESIERIVAATNELGSDYQELLRRRFQEKWFHLAPEPQKGATVGVFWQVGGGHPHVIMKYGGDYAAARMLAGAAVLMMGYASVPADAPPDRREEDFPVFSNALWTLGPLLLDRHMMARPLDTQEKIAILSGQLTWLLQSFVRNTLIAEFEVMVAERISSGTPPTGAEMSALYRRLLVDYFGEAITIDEELGREWMTFRTLFYGPHYGSFAAATALAVILDERLAAGNETARAAVRDGIGRSDTHLSGEVLRGAGIDLSDASTYQPVARRIEALTRELQSAIEGKPVRP